MDKLLEALELADAIWDKAALGDRVEKMGYAAELNRKKVFSVPQIAKIVRLNSRYVYEELSSDAKGGRFDPATLSTLARIRRSHIERRTVPHALIRTGIEGGTSYSCLVQLTGIPYSKYYEVARELAGESVIAGVQREKIFSYRDSGLTQAQISQITGVDQPTISRVLKGKR